jgi:hypothetical protein
MINLVWSGAERLRRLESSTGFLIDKYLQKRLHRGEDSKMQNEGNDVDMSNRRILIGLDWSRRQRSNQDMANVENVSVDFDRPIQKTVKM